MINLLEKKKKNYFNIISFIQVDYFNCFLIIYLFIFQISFLITYKSIFLY
jgi:hypothetical protein